MPDRLTLGVALAAAVLGACSMGPSVGFGDAGELSAAAAGLGLAHSPGYPLYALLAKSFGTALPLGNWAYRTNFLSVLLSALAVGLFSEALRRQGFGVWARLSGTLTLGLSPVWIFSGGATEVFALHHAILAGIIFLLSAERSPASARLMAAGGLAVGLGLANHHAAVLALPAVLAELASRRPSPRAWARGLGLAAAFALIGLACYAYLPIRSASGPPLDWGHPTNVERFLRVLLRKDYGSFSLTVEGAAPVSRWAQAARYGRETFLGLGPAALPLAAVGAVCWRGLGAGLGAAFPLLWIFGLGPLLLLIGNPPLDQQTSYALERFYPASWMGVGLLAAAGTEALARRWRPAAALLALVPFLWSGARSREWFAREDFAAHDYGRDLLRSLPPGASLFMDGGDDTFYTLAYMRHAQGLRPDLDLHDRGGLVFPNPYGADFRGLSKGEKDVRRGAVESALARRGRLHYTTLAETLVPGTVLSPAGLLRRPVFGGKEPPSPLWEFYARRWSFPLAERHYRYRALIAFYPFMRAAGLLSELRTGRAEAGGAAMVELQRAFFLAPDALWIKPSLAFSSQLLGFEFAQRREWDSAERAYRFGLSVSPDDPEIHLNLGVALDRTGAYGEAEKAYRRAAELSPRSPQPWRNLGTMFWGLGRWPESAEAFKKAFALAPHDRSLRVFAEESARRAGGSLR